MQSLKVQDALSAKAADECGLGKLCLQLLSFASIGDPTLLVQLFASYEPLASPVLTMLLDIPWVELAQAGWPFFGLLAQINLRKGEVAGAMNTDAIDGLDDHAARSFKAELSAALAAADGLAVEKAASTFLQADPKGSALGPLTALAAQAVAAAPPERVQILQALQLGFRQVIGSAGELDIALSTQWPLWALLHVAIDSLLA